MHNVQSPHFSTCSKAELLSRLSPSFRSKRVPSVQDHYSHSTNILYTSHRKHSSPSKISQNTYKVKCKKSQVNQNKITKQIIQLKDQYQGLKQAYKQLIKQKLNNNKIITQIMIQKNKIIEQTYKIQKQNQKYQNKIIFLEIEMQRIRKQSYKFIQIEKFKIKKLQESLLEKDQAIKSLLKFLENFSYNNNQLENLKALLTKSIPHPSLTLSDDQPILPETPFLSISLTSMIQDDCKQISTQRKQSQLILQKKKENQQKEVQKIVISKKNGENLKKMRKQLKKKLQINMDEKIKQPHNKPPKTPTQPTINERKNSKLKNSKSKKKNEDDKQNQQVKQKKKTN